MTLVTVASNGGVTALHAARKFGFIQATTDTDSILADPAVSSVVIATRHDSHADLTIRALAAGKHVYVEKPLALTTEEVDAVEAALRDAPGRLLMVGFNRRFAPHIGRMKVLLAGSPGPKAFVMTVNAGAIPASHWAQDRSIGGGRIIGEACHFVDLLRHLVGTSISAYSAASLAQDTVSIELGFDDGSIGTIHYFANGAKSFPKERLEVFAGGRVLQLDNFKSLRGYSWPGLRTMNLMRQDKGQRGAVSAFLAAVEQGGAPPIPLEELFEVARTTIAIAEGI